MKTAFTIIALILGFAAFIPYFIEIWKKTAKPHVFSWITWGILTGLGFFLSLSAGGGEGAWVFGLQSALCLVIAVYALIKGEKNITRMDWVTFTSAIIITVIYIFTKNAVISVFLAASIDSLGFVPTFRKSFMKPFDEPSLTYFLSFLGFIFSIGALQSYSFVTMFYPLILVVTNGAFVLFLLVRRRSLAVHAKRNLV